MALRRIGLIWGWPRPMDWRSCSAGTRSSSASNRVSPMLPDGSLHVDRVWKRFRDDRHRALLRDEIARLRARRKGDPSVGWRWALRDISFDVAPGESIALIGMNGSGKSTLLKVLVGVMFPYAGRVETAGRVGALIEVRAGIHPELTARENIFMYGTLLGLKRPAISARFDDIVSFAGVEEAVDRQVKFYSSGMSMRLGFAVAAFLEPDLLIVDEVLAVGDAEFQKRCLDRMRDVLAVGTTLVYVSHDLPTVQAMCQRAIWIDHGEQRRTGSTAEVLGAYRRSIEEHTDHEQVRLGPVRVLAVRPAGRDGQPLTAGGPMQVEIDIAADVTRTFDLVLGVTEATSTPIFLIQTSVEASSEIRTLCCNITQLPVGAGNYSLWLGAFGADHTVVLPWQSFGHLAVGGPELTPTPTGVVRLSPVYVPATWEK